MPDGKKTVTRSITFSPWFCILNMKKHKEYCIDAKNFTSRSQCSIDNWLFRQKIFNRIAQGQENDEARLKYDLTATYTTSPLFSRCSNW